MKALVWQGRQDFRVEDVSRPTAQPGQIVVRVKTAAICGSDSHLADFGAKPPLTPGHEVAGVVEEVGSEVAGLSAGDRVALDPVQRCGSCWCCTHGVEHLCLRYRHLGDRAVPGGWAEYVAIDAANAHRIPDAVSFEAACLAEPAAVCYESFERCALRPGDTVLVLGDGPFGFLHAQIARARGAGRIIVAGHYDRRLERIAAGSGAITCNTHRENLEAVLGREIGPPGVDVVIEATGSGASPNIGLAALRPRGSLVIFSYIWKPQPMDMGKIHMLEINVLGSCRSRAAYGPCLDLMGRGKIDTGALVDLRVRLEDCREAMARLAGHKADTFKCVFLPG
jgi:threonine dehydrogenase-like Zn-dependent dehydrogenase